MTVARPSVGLLGFGHAEPLTVRGNDDPIFDWIHANDPTHGQLFTGYVSRRVLAEGEEIETFMVQAAQSALANSGLKAADIDMLLGFTSVSAYANPNGLAQVHAALGLAGRCWVMPINADFSNYPAALMIADGLIAAGRARNILVVCGSNWTRHVNYHTPQCISAGDGAGAAVIGLRADPSHWRVVDHEASFHTGGYGHMFMQGDLLDGAAPAQMDPPFTDSFSRPYFHITGQGITEYKIFGVEEPPKVVARLLERNAIAGSAIALIAHQPSSYLLNAWQRAIGPAQMLDTIEQFANLAIGNLAVTLAVRWTEIKTNYLVLLGMGPEPHASALLLRRAGRKI